MVGQGSKREGLCLGKGTKMLQIHCEQQMQVLNDQRPGDLQRDSQHMTAGAPLARHLISHQCYTSCYKYMYSGAISPSCFLLHGFKCCQKNFCCLLLLNKVLSCESPDLFTPSCRTDMCALPHQHPFTRFIKCVNNSFKIHIQVKYSSFTKLHQVT